MRSENLGKKVKSCEEYHLTHLGSYQSWVCIVRGREGRTL
jgi:hypothetical protein